jgi:1,4-alpha-glucan branching enzyme
MDGFQWVNLSHRNECILVYKRIGRKKGDELLIILNLSPVVHHDWQLDLKGKLPTTELFNSDLAKYGGTGDVYNPEIRWEWVDKTEKAYRLTLNIPPLAALVLK